MADPKLLEELLENPKIPTPPSVALQVLERVGRPDCTLQEIRDIIRHDPALCGLMLKTLNSILYCFSHAVTTIDQALVLLGLSRVRSLVLTLYLPALRNSCRSTPHLRSFWKSSVIGAILARELAAKIGRTDPESDLLAGLMRDMGMVVLSQLYPIEYAAQLSRASDEPETYLCELEEEWLGYNHADISAAMLAKWRLPMAMTQAVACHHHPDRADEDNTEARERAWLLNFATLGAQFVMAPQIPGLRRQLVTLAQARYGMNEQQLAAFLNPLSKKVKELAVLLNVEVGKDVNYAAILTSVSEELAKLTLETSLASIREEQSKHQVEQEVTQWKNTANRLREKNARDVLTGLFNRAYFFDTTTAELRRSRRRFSVLGLMFIDLDGFKPLNDQFGHAFGDQVLKEVATTLQANLRATDIVARLGGDEFCVLLPHTPETAFKMIGERLVRSINKMDLQFGRQRCGVGASVGVAYCLPFSNEVNIDQLMETADQAMYESKAGGKNQVTMKSLFTEKDRQLLDMIERRGFRSFLIRRGIVTDQQINSSPGTRVYKPCLQRIARRLGWIGREDAVALTREQRLRGKRFHEVAASQGYLQLAEIWTLLAVQQEPPEALGKRIVHAGLVSDREMQAEITAYYAAMGAKQSLTQVGMRPGTRARTQVGKKLSTIIRPTSKFSSNPGSRS